MSYQKPKHILDFSEGMFQKVMQLFNVVGDANQGFYQSSFGDLGVKSGPQIDRRLANRQKSKKFVTIPKLHKFLADMLDTTDAKIMELIEKIDHKNKEKITWTEFLLFMNKECEKREIVNDANIFG